MKNIIFALAALAILAGCDAGSRQEPSASPTEMQRKTDDSKKF